MNLTLETKLAKLPPEWPEPLSTEIRDRVLATERTLVVLDDDPTGTQTVFDVPVLTEWSVSTLRGQLALEDPAFFILTNSRSLPESEAIDLAHEIGTNLLAASRDTGRAIDLVSRSDSTLRGHYPAEVDALAEVAELADAITVIAPFFLEGGRLTIDDVHYVIEGDQLVPAADTPFAQDAAFGFSQSDLKQWVAEKSCERIAAEEVASISLAELREGGPEAVAAKLRELPARSVCIVNAVTLRDMEVFALATMLAQESSHQFVFRSAASFVQARAGLATQPLLSADAIVDRTATAGLIVAGSYVPKTTAQLNHLHENHGDQLAHVELSARAVLNSSAKPIAIRETISQVNNELNQGRDVVLSTSRDLITRPDHVANLAVGMAVSAALVEIVRSINPPLRFLIAKGGITSSDLATRALNVRRATVLGQILPGVPVWRLGDESRLPGLGYVIFPGNVGDESALSDAYLKLRYSESPHA